MDCSNENNINYPFLNKYSCPVEAMVEVWWGKWKGVILSFIRWYKSGLMN